MKKKNGKYNYNIEAFTNCDDISYYLLGAFITDGCVSDCKTYKVATISSKDEEWLQTIRDIICPDKPVHNRNDGKIYVLQVNNTLICDWLIAHDCVPNKSRTVTFPQIPKKYLADFIRGCMDGDGSIGTYNCFSKSNGYHIRRNCSISTGSKDFATGLSLNLNELNLKHCLSIRTKDALNKRKLGAKINGKKIKANGDFYTISFSGKTAFNFLREIYFPNHKISMLRKNNLAQEIISHYNSIEV